MFRLIVPPHRPYWRNGAQYTSVELHMLPTVYHILWIKLLSVSHIHIIIYFWHYSVLEIFWLRYLQKFIADTPSLFEIICFLMNKAQSDGRTEFGFSPATSARVAPKLTRTHCHNWDETCNLWMHRYTVPTSITLTAGASTSSPIPGPTVTATVTVLTFSVLTEI